MSASKAEPSAKFAGEIRPPRPRDFARIADLSRQLGYPTTPDEIALRLDGMKNSPDHAVFVAQLPNGEIAGWIAAFLYRGVELDTRAEISGLVVDERFRSQNVGLRLLSCAENWAREKGCKEVSLRSNVIRERAHKFYERHGYVHTKTQKSFRKPLS
jgi:GNAT superfamily N-acetyltransferase